MTARDRHLGFEGRVRLLPFVALVVCVVLVAIADLPGPTAPLPVTLAVVAVTAGWIYWLGIRHPQWEHRDRLMAVFFVGLLFLIGVLILCNSLFGFFAWTGYIFVLYALRGRWRLLALAASASCWRFRRWAVSTTSSPTRGRCPPSP